MYKTRKSQSKIKIILCFILFFNYKINKENTIANDLEDNLLFINQFTTIKPIAFYNTKNYIMNETFIINGYFTNKISSNINFDKMKMQIKLAKMHGIYGFGFYYFWPCKLNIFNNPIDIFSENKNLNINFLLIWKNEENEILSNYNINQFFYQIKKYVLDNRYIKIDNKIALGIETNNIKENDIMILRQLFKKNKLGEIFVLSNANDKNIHIILKSKIFDGIYHSTQYNSLKKVDYNNSDTYFYTRLIYHNLILKFPNDYEIFRTTEAFTKYPINIKNAKISIYGDYSPEKFYFLNKILINWTLNNRKEENQYIFINDYHNLEPNNLFGYANINYFSKALYNLPITNNNYKLINLQNNELISVHIHVFYIDLLADIIKKVNNIPVPFDLYITTNNLKKKMYINDYLKIHSNASKYEIMITPNKGRDIIPMIIQLKDIIRKYKYICHIHTKKHKNKKSLGIYWRIYLYKNLIGTKDVISRILSDFENHNQLALIFPEPLYSIINEIYYNSPLNIKHLNHLIHLLFPEKRYKITKVLNFPSGNMFWAKTSAIYQIFDEKIIKSVPKEKGQIDGTILHAIERFWPFLVMFNGYYYKSIFYSI